MACQTKKVMMMHNTRDMQSIAMVSSNSVMTNVSRNVYNGQCSVVSRNGISWKENLVSVVYAWCSIYHWGKIMSVL